MKFLKVTLLAAIFSTCFVHLSWAQIVENISVDSDSRNVKVLMNLCDGKLSESGIRTTLYGDILNASFTADDSFVVQCESKLLVTLHIPPCVEFGEVGVFFYSRLLGNETPSLQTGMNIDEANCADIQPAATAASVDISLCQTKYEDCLSVANLGGLFLGGGCDAACCLDAYNKCMSSNPVEDVIIREVEIETNPTIQVIYETDMECAPKKLNVSSKGKWVTCSISGSIDETGPITLNVNGQPAKTEKVVKEDGAFVVKLNRQSVIDAVNKEPGDIVIGLSGSSAIDVITVVNPGTGKKNEKVKQNKNTKNKGK
jgi:hypothetical protein